MTKLYRVLISSYLARDALPFAFKLRLSIPPPPLDLSRHQSWHFALSTGGRDGERGEGHDGTEARARRSHLKCHASHRGASVTGRGVRDRVLASYSQLCGNWQGRSWNESKRRNVSKRRAETRDARSRELARTRARVTPRRGDAHLTSANFSREPSTRATSW